MCILYIKVQVCTSVHVDMQLRIIKEDDERIENHSKYSYISIRICKLCQPYLGSEIIRICRLLKIKVIYV